MQPRPFNTSSPILYLITDRTELDPGSEPDARMTGLLDLLARAAAAGVDLIQIREKDLSGQRLFELARAAIAAVRPYGARVLINDRVDVALAAQADGVHLTTTSVPVEAVRRWAGDAFLIGASTHNAAEVARAEAGGADFVVFGPIYATASKLSYGRPLGLSALAEITRRTALPVFAIGGINEANYAMVLAQGARGVAAIKLFAQAKDLAEVVPRLKRPES